MNRIIDDVAAGNNSNLSACWWDSFIYNHTSHLICWLYFVSLNLSVNLKLKLLNKWGHGTRRKFLELLNNMSVPPRCSCSGVTQRAMSPHRRLFPVHVEKPCELTLLMSLPKVSLKLEPRISNWTWELEPPSLKSIVPVRPVMLPWRETREFPSDKTVNSSHTEWKMSPLSRPQSTLKFTGTLLNRILSCSRCRRGPDSTANFNTRHTKYNEVTERGRETLRRRRRDDGRKTTRRR